MDVRNKEGVGALLERLSREGFSGNRRLRVYFAPVEASTEACASIACQVLRPEAYGETETVCQAEAVRLGLANRPYPGRFSGICAAVRPRGFVILPNGDVHKCWHTVSDPGERICTVDELADGIDIRGRPVFRKWLDYSPFEAKCRDCALLPCCTGACPYKHIVSRQDPCPSTRYNLAGRLRLFAGQEKRKTGAPDRSCDAAYV